MKQNLNFTLLGLLVVVLIAMIAMTFYYLNNYTGLSEEYKESLNANNNLSYELIDAKYELIDAKKQVMEKENELNERIRNLNLSSSEVVKFENINKNLSAGIEAMNFDEIYETIDKLKSRADLLENETMKDKLNNEINILEQEVVELENQFFTIKALAETKQDEE